MKQIINFIAIVIIFALLLACAFITALSLPVLGYTTIIGFAALYIANFTTVKEYIYTPVTTLFDILTHKKR